MCIRLKKNGKDTKDISLIGQGFQAYIDHLFWNLPFSNPKQAHDILTKKEMSVIVRRTLDHQARRNQG
jgi:hypothetical protein